MVKAAGPTSCIYRSHTAWPKLSFGTLFMKITSSIELFSISALLGWWSYVVFLDALEKQRPLSLRYAEVPQLFFFWNPGSFFSSNGVYCLLTYLEGSFRTSKFASSFLQPWLPVSLCKLKALERRHWDFGSSSWKHSLVLQWQLKQAGTEQNYRGSCWLLSVSRTLTSNNGVVILSGYLRQTELKLWNTVTVSLPWWKNLVNSQLYAACQDLWTVTKIGLSPGCLKAFSPQAVLRLECYQLWVFRMFVVNVTFAVFKRLVDHRESTKNAVRSTA